MFLYISFLLLHDLLQKNYRKKWGFDFIIIIIIIIILFTIIRCISVV